MDGQHADPRIDAMRARTARNRETWTASTASMDATLTRIAQQIEQIRTTIRTLGY